MDAGGGGADDVSRPEKTLPLWLKPLLSLQHLQPPAGKQIRPEEEVSFGSTNRFLTHKGQGSMTILPVVNTYSGADLHVITHTLTHVPSHSSSKVGPCQSNDSEIKTFLFLILFFCYIDVQQGKSVKDSDVDQQEKINTNLQRPRE